MVSQVVSQVVSSSLRGPRSWETSKTRQPKQGSPGKDEQAEKQVVSRTEEWHVWEGARKAGPTSEVELQNGTPPGKGL